MPKIVGFAKAGPLALCKQGANQHSHVLLRKNAAAAARDGSTTADPQPLENEMKPEEVAALLAKSAGWNDVTKAHYTALDSAAQVTFMAKSAIDQAAEAQTAKEAADRKVAEEAAAKTATVTDLEKALQASPLFKSVIDENVALKAKVASLEGGTMDLEIEKTAARDYAGFPGGSVEAVKRLKSIAKLPVEEREPMYEAMKAQTALARKTAHETGQTRKAAEGSPREHLNTKAQELATAKSISVQKAFLEVSRDPANAELVRQIEDAENAAIRPAA